jgi:aryl-alcohol dehydrogenase-like predicted oxidoreductase
VITIFYQFARIQEAKMIERRDFLKTMLTAVPGMMIACNSGKNNDQDRLGQVLPKRLLGKSGAAVTMLGLGGYHIGWTTERDAQETIDAALAGGIRFFDTAESYARGLSESRYGKFLVPEYRDLVFLMTKSTGKDAATVKKHLAESLQRLNTDHLDLWQVHAISDAQDVDNRIANGVLDVFEEAKASGKARYIGFTGHRNPAAHRRMLERTKDRDIFDTCQMPVNVLDPSRHSFIRSVMPEVQKRKIALLAMKTLADGRFFPVKQKLENIEWQTDDPVIPDRISIQDALHFVWSLPVSVLITGAENAELVQEKITLARRFIEMDAKARETLIDKVADLAIAGKVEYFKQVES